MVLIGGLFVGVFARGWKQYLLNHEERKLNDVVVVAYLLINLISLLVSDAIFDTFNIRLLFAAVLLYFTVQKFKPTQDQKKFLLHAIGVFTIFLASLSLFHLLLPGLFNYISVNYFSARNPDGSLNYGLLRDYMRGRLFPWGAVIMSFPAFYASSILLRKTRRRLSVPYFVVGFIILVFSMVSSNFRWTVLCFVTGSFIFFRIEFMNRILSLRTIMTVMMPFIVSILLSLGIGRVYLGYNLLDRILLKNPNRDVTEALGRVHLFNQAINLSLVSPLTGVGIGNYLYFVEPYYYLRYFTKLDQVEVVTSPSASHNELITILAESGIFGLILFILFIYLTIKKIIILFFLEHHLFTDTDRVLLLSILVSYITFFFYSLFENISFHNYVYLFALSGIVFSWFPVRKAKL